MQPLFVAALHRFPARPLVGLVRLPLQVEDEEQLALGVGRYVAPALLEALYGFRRNAEHAGKLRLRLAQVMADANELCAFHTNHKAAAVAALTTLWHHYSAGGRWDSR